MEYTQDPVIYYDVRDSRGTRYSAYTYRFLFDTLDYLQTCSNADISSLDSITAIYKEGYIESKAIVRAVTYETDTIVIGRPKDRFMYVE